MSADKQEVFREMEMALHVAVEELAFDEVYAIVAKTGEKRQVARALAQCRRAIRRAKSVTESASLK